MPRRLKVMAELEEAGLGSASHLSRPGLLTRAIVITSTICSEKRDCRGRLRRSSCFLVDRPSSSAPNVMKKASHALSDLRTWECRPRILAENG